MLTNELGILYERFYLYFQILTNVRLIPPSATKIQFAKTLKATTVAFVREDIMAMASIAVVGTLLVFPIAQSFMLLQYKRALKTPSVVIEPNDIIFIREYSRKMN